MTLKKIWCVFELGLDFTPDVVFSRSLSFISISGPSSHEDLHDDFV